MAYIFNGRRRGLGMEPEKEIFIKLEVSFRRYMHHFKGAKLAVFLAIQLHADEHGQCWPSYDKLQEETGYGRAAVAAALDELCTMVVEGTRVLTRRRERDERGLFTGSNHYLIYPSKDELKEWEPEFAYPTVDLSNCGKSELEEEPSSKEEPTTKKNQRAAANDAPPALAPTPEPLPVTASRNDNPPVPPGPPKPSDHPFVQAYRETFQRFPARAQMVQLAKIAVTPPALDRWQSACTAWLMSGYNPTKVQGILDWYRNGVPEYQARRNARSHRAAAPAAYRPPTDAERQQYIDNSPPLEI